MRESKGHWVIRTYRAGKVIEKTKMYICGSHSVNPRKHRVKGATTAAKRDRNATAAVRTLSRLINCNFDKHDIYLTLSFDDEHYPEDRAAMQKETVNFIRRLTRSMAKAGAPEVKYITVLSEKDGKTGNQVRKHAHIVISGKYAEFKDGEWYVGKKTISQIWGRGIAYAEPLRNQDDYTPLAVYLIKQATADENAKKYTCSRNMAQPIITEEDCVTDRQFKAPKGATICENRYDTLIGENYIRYIAPKSPANKIRMRR